MSVPLGVFIASLLGSTHCAAMCGPIAVMVNSRSGYLALYHLGRLSSYLALGALAGLLGETFLSGSYPVISFVSLSAVSLFLVYTGYRLVRGRPPELLPGGVVTSMLRGPAKWSLAQRKPVASLTLGVVNGFIPCGWVYIFVIGAVATKDPLYGGAMLFIFWLGTLPALSALPYLYKKGMKRAPIRMGVIAGVILIAIGLANLAVHMIPPESGGHDHSRTGHMHHHHME